MSIQKTSVQQTQTNKCPHGLPVGTCPICNGSMGSKKSKDRDKPRVPGEMSYNECLAAWMKIQAMKEAKLKAQIEKMNQIKEAINQARKETKLQIIKKSLDNYIQKLNDIKTHLQNAPKIIQVTAKIIVNIIKPVLQMTSFIVGIVNSAINTISNITRFIISIVEKLPSMVKELFFEIKKIIQDGKEILKKATQVILNLFCQNKDNQEKEDSKKQSKLKKLFKKLKGNR